MGSLVSQGAYVSILLTDSQFQPEERKQKSKIHKGAQIQKAGSSQSFFTPHSICVGEIPRISFMVPSNLNLRRDLRHYLRQFIHIRDRKTGPAFLIHKIKR